MKKRFKIFEHFWGKKTFHRVWVSW